MKLERLIALMMLLLNNQKMSAKSLAERFEVSTRTIYRDLDTLLVAGVPIMTQKGVGGGIYIDEAYKVDRQFFSINEMTHLLTGLKGISTAIDDQGLQIAYEKVKHLVPETYAGEIKDLTERIHVDLSTWQGHESMKGKLKAVQFALHHKQIITFDYLDKKGNASQRRVESYRLLFKENAWYLEAYCLIRMDFRMFKLNRMLKVNMTKELFQMRPFTPMDSSREGWIKDKLLQIEVHFKADLLEIMVERCGEDHITEIAKGLYHVFMDFVDEPYSYNMLLGFGTSLILIGPSHIREKFITHIENIQAIYINDAFLNS